MRLRLGSHGQAGFVRINVPNPHGGYRHDTPARGISAMTFVL
jgi:murein L,D-transpeptidase YcbB/YkuD